MLGGNIDRRRGWFEGFEGDIDNWTVNDTLWGRDSAHAHSGQYAGGGTANTTGQQVLAENEVFGDGSQPTDLDFYWLETSDSTGGGLRLVNSNGGYEVGMATDNPQWILSDGNGTTQVYDGGGHYGNWIHVEWTFDWPNAQYDYTITNTATGTSRSGTGQPLHAGTDVTTLHIEDYNTGWTSGTAYYMWHDDLVAAGDTVSERIVYTWTTGADWDNAQDEQMVHHAAPRGTDWPGTGAVELGYTTYDIGGNALRGYWTCDEDVSGEFLDSSSASNAMTLNGNATAGSSAILGPTTGTFDGTGDYARATNVACNETAYAAACWFKYSAHDTNGVIMMSGGSSTAWPTDGWTLNFDGNNDYLNLYHHRNGTNTEALAFNLTPLSTGTWYYLGVTTDGGKDAARAHLYDGTGRLASATGQGTRGVTDTNPFTIGEGNGAGVDCEIDEVRVYNRGLSRAEFDRLALQSLPGSLTTASRTANVEGDPQLLRTSVDLKLGSVDVTVHEDATGDGTPDASQTVALAGGTDEENSLSGFGGHVNADYWVDLEFSVPSITDNSPEFTDLQLHLWP